MAIVSLLKIEGVTKWFGGLQALKNCSLEIGEGEIRGLIGPNGAGKTTLLNVISGVLKCDKGRIVFREKDVTGLASHRIAKKGIVRTFQIPKLFLRMTLWENLLAISKVENTQKRALEFLEIADLTHLKDEFARILSYGQQKIFSMCRALMVNPSLLMLDEPTAGLNLEEKIKIMSFIHNLNERFNITFLIIEHDMSIIEGHCSMVSVLHYGEKIAEGTYEEIRKESKVREAYFGEE